MMASIKIYIDPSKLNRFFYFSFLLLLAIENRNLTKANALTKQNVERDTSKSLSTQIHRSYKQKKKRQHKGSPKPNRFEPSPEYSFPFNRQVRFNIGIPTHCEFNSPRIFPYSRRSFSPVPQIQRPQPYRRLQITKKCTGILENILHNCS